MIHESKETKLLVKLCVAAMMAALVFAGNYMRIKIPVSLGGTTAFTLANILCALSGLLLGPWWGGLAAGMGSAIYDMTNPMYIDECWITFLTKGAYGLAAGLVMWSGHRKLTYPKATLAAATGAVLYAVLYLAKGYFYDALFKEGIPAAAAWLTIVGKIPATVFNGVVAIIFAPMLAIAIHKALDRNHLTLE